MPISTRHTPKNSAYASPGDSRTNGLARLHAVATAALLCTGMLQISDAQAMALGRLIVQSPLGAPLRAEIEVLEITKEQSDNLKVGLGSTEAFSAAGMQYNAALGNLSVTLQRRANGQAFLQLSGSRPVSEPFIDLVLEANWNAGRVTRNYTLLFDPPNIRPAAPAPIAPIAAAPVASPPAGPASATNNTRVLPPAGQPAAQAQSAETPRNDRVRVEAGDTAGAIAADNLPANVSLDQMLVAMLRNNPQAFIKGNVNRVKAGAVLTLPDSTTAGAISSGEARQIISAQSQDFNDFRRRLADRVPDAPAATAEREATGQIQAEVKDQKPAPVTQDKLTISKGATPGQSAAEEKIAKERQAQEAASRTAELSRNIEELSQVGKTTVAAGSPPATPVATTPDVTTASPAAEPPAAEAEPMIEEVVPTESPIEPEPAVVEPAPAPTPVPATPAKEETSFVGQLLESPLVLPIAGGLLALLAGLGIYGVSRRKKATGVDSSFLESRLQPDSFFGSSGGQRIDTSEAAASGSSMVYSPSQLDAAGDVDPVAEADVYLAYGRDLQAEEILKEAMRSTPTRVAIHIKLLEIYAKRRDAKGFEVVATEAYALTQGGGAEWAHACELGKELDPTNPMYQPGGQPAVKVALGAMGTAGGPATVPFGNSTQSPSTKSSESDSTDIDFDLDLDLDQPSQPAVLSSGGTPLSAMDDLSASDALTGGPLSESAPMSEVANSEPMGFDLDFPSEPMPLSADEPIGSFAPAPFDAGGSMADFNLVADSTKDLPPPSNAAEKSDSDLMAFDLNDIKLDFNDDQLPTTEPGALSEENPLETKLSLAEEFRAIGDMEGARSLAEEVLAEASGSLKSKVTTFLADLS